jgi:hypothetical protein
MEKITKEMYETLKKPLAPEAVTKHPTKTYLSSIKAIFVTERLNDVFGCGSWQIRVEKQESGEKGMVVVKVTLSIPEYGVYYESFGGNDNGGESSKNFDLGDAFKGATTDGITKIGSYLGIGISVFKGQGNGVSKPNMQINGNTPPDNVPADKTFITAWTELENSKSIEQVTLIWNKYPSLHKDENFTKEVTRLGRKFKTVTQ